MQLGKLLVRLNRPGAAREAGERGLTSVQSASSRGLAEGFLRDLELDRGGR